MSRFFFHGWYDRSLDSLKIVTKKRFKVCFKHHEVPALKLFMENEENKFVLMKKGSAFCPEEMFQKT